jgi:hypothetical protein
VGDVEPLHGGASAGSLFPFGFAVFSASPVVVAASTTRPACSVA